MATEYRGPYNTVNDEETLEQFKARRDNPHQVTKDQVGLDQVDNTADIDKPVSTLQQDALDGKADNGHTHTLDDITDADDISSIPSGGIIMWSGSIDNIPSDWVLCDGNNGTPDLRNRFVVGAGNNYSVDDTGGSDSVTLTVSEIPSHSHSASTDSAGSHTHSYRENSRTKTSMGGSDYYRYNSQFTTKTTGSAGAHTHSVTVDSTGGGESHENRPPYYALAYIMKT